MANEKISQLTPASSLTGSEIIPLALSGANYSTTPSQILSSGLIGVFGGSSTISSIIASIGWNWAAGTDATIYVSSEPQISVVGQSIRSSQASETTIGVAGFGLFNGTASQSGGVWGGYFEALNKTSTSNASMIGVEIDIGETQTTSIQQLWGNGGKGGGYRTIGLQVASGGSSNLTYTNASTAINIAANTTSFDKGIVFNPAALVTQSGSFQNAINFGTTARINWWRNNSGSDQLASFIGSNDTTTGTTLGVNLTGIDFGGSAGSASTGTVIIYGETVEFYSATTTEASLIIGEGATGNRISSIQFICSTNGGADYIIQAGSGRGGILLFNCIGSGGGVAVEINGSNALIVGAGATGVQLPNYGQGILVSSSSGVISSYGSVLPQTMIQLSAVNFNSANTDNSITIPSPPPGCTRYIVSGVYLSSASHTLTTATCGLFTATAAGGTAIVSSGTSISLSSTADGSANNFQSLTVATTTYSWTQSGYGTLYFRTQTAEGSTATANVTLILSWLP